MVRIWKQGIQKAKSYPPNQHALLEGHKEKMMLGKYVKAVVLLVKLGTVSYVLQSGPVQLFILRNWVMGARKWGGEASGPRRKKGKA